MHLSHDLSVRIACFSDISLNHMEVRYSQIEESNLYITAYLADAQPLSHESHYRAHCFALSFEVNG
ncbi:Uncharacterized protein APZ42_027588 [Daphnia magna]|uniref:Uncharacterized protein n=1 Tax=Daphnia magna TaxID=35525 RepID=A0A164R8I1_9CRUS|nr:Uncharacterized protein APZ42_027588 [Daphnia magna]